jgi:prepilin-type processing-associated H-X9-DG protein
MIHGTGSSDGAPQRACRHCSQDPSSSLGFARTDLVAVLAILAVLGALLAGSLGRAAAGNPASVCQDNLRKLSLAWYLYASEAGGRLVNNLTIPEIQNTVTSKKYLNWANNVMDWGINPMNTNRLLTATSKLSPYLGVDPDLFHCPNDTNLSPVQVKVGWARRERSYSMNGSLGSPFERVSSGQSTAAGVSEWCPERRQFLTVSALSQPSRTFVFLEEHPDSINDGLFLLGCESSGVWHDLPGSFHDGAGGFAFADGHVELHPWLNEATKRPVRLSSLPEITVPELARDDYQWVLDHTAAPLTQLGASRGTSQQVQITWSQLPTNYTLEVTERLPSGSWTNSSLSPERSLGQNAIHVPAEGQQRFFRLRQ